MSDDNFLERWSRLKREAAQQRQQETAPSDETVNAHTTDAPTNDAAPAAAKAGDADAPFDPASLPPIESIDALSDIRAFLAPGVPAALTRAALRRAWAADPTIRDFVGLSENSWDFTAPGSIPGFGDIGGDEELRRLVAHLTDGADPATPKEGDGPVAEPAEAPQNSQITQESVAPDATDDPAEPRLAAEDTNLLQDSKSDTASQYEAKVAAGEGATRRGHGRALPE
jgi:Protein of unknown function (DUF3306)